MACVAGMIGRQAVESVLWVGEHAPAGCAGVSPKAIASCLGDEYAALVFDGHSGFHPDALAAALGTLRGGGVLYLLLPDWDDWPTDHDPALMRLASWPQDAAAVGRRFFRRLRRKIEAADCFEILGGGVELPVPLAQVRAAWTLNPDQQQVAAAVERVALGHARRPLVVTADRGRGKSTALGAGLARLLKQGRQVILCAPSADAVQSVFAQLARELPQGRHLDHSFSWGDGAVRFRQAHEQLSDPQPCDLLVVDEAAALGLGALEALLHSHRRLVFSTTVHGYEGSGRGFLLRFMQRLREHMPQCRQVTLQVPVRWPPGDPLEHWLNDSLLLAAEPREASGPANPRYRWITQDALAGDETLLRQLFGLLVSAHYQTRPSDLQQLLDAPGLRVLLAQDGEVVLGAALLVEEGGFPRGLAEQVCLGRRRPRGHLLLQSLAQHAGWCDAPRLRALRIMRIVVQAPARGQGVGSGLLAAARAVAQAQGFDLLGTAFGVEAGLLAFWHRAGYRMARIGYRVDPASGAHSAQLLLGMSDAGQALADAAHAAFQRDLPLRLQRELGDLSPELVTMLLAAAPPHHMATDERDPDRVRLFARGGMSLADARPALWRWLLSRGAAGLTGGDELLVREILLAPATHVPDRAVVRRLRAKAAAILRLTGDASASTFSDKIKNRE